MSFNGALYFSAIFRTVLGEIILSFNRAIKNNGHETFFSSTDMQPAPLWRRQG